MSKTESSSDVERWLSNQTADIGLAILGSLSLRRSPCIRENCQACPSGEQHRSYVLYGSVKGRRFSVYVPEELVADVRRCLDNGRALQELLYEGGTALYQGFEAREGPKLPTDKRAERCRERRTHRSVLPTGS